MEILFSPSKYKSPERDTNQGIYKITQPIFSLFKNLNLMDKKEENDEIFSP